MNFKTFSSLKIRNYRLYFIGQAVSLSGTWIQTIAQSWLVLQLTGSGTALGFVTALQYIPMFLLGPYGGVLVDRFPRRKILYLTQGVAGLLALILGVLVLTGSVKIWMLYILALALGLTNALDNPARQKFSLEMVGKDQLQNAISLNATLVSLARAIGPAIAGVLILTLGIGLCFIANAISYIAVLVALMMMREKEMYLLPLVLAKRGQVMEGFKYIKENPLIRDTLILISIIGTFSYEFQVVAPLFAKFTLNGNEMTYTIITTAMGVGSMIGGFFAASRKRTAPHILVDVCLLFALSMFLVSLSPNLIIASICLALTGATSIILISLGNVTLQLESSPEMRGRVLALWAVGFFGSSAIGGPIIGWVCEVFNPRWGMAVGGFAAIFAAIVAIPTLKKDRYFKIPQKLK
jgi:MFS family permease